MAKLLMHLGFGAKKKANICNNSSMDNPNRKIDVNVDANGENSGAVRKRIVNGERVILVNGGVGELGCLDGSDLDVGRRSHDARKASTEEQQVVVESCGGKYLLHTDSLLLASNNMKRQNAIKLGVNGRRNRSATDGQMVDVNQRRGCTNNNIPISQKKMLLGYHLPSQTAVTPKQTPVSKLPSLEDDYAVPVDFCFPANSSSARPAPSWLTHDDADYTEPFLEAVANVGGPLDVEICVGEAVEGEERVVDDDDDDLEFAYDEVYEYKDDHRLNLGQRAEADVDDRPSEEYDSPWEWREIPRLMPQRNNDAGCCENVVRAVSLEEEEVEGSCHASQLGVNMSGGRPRRHIYETAFDSTIQTSAKDADDEIVNHPILTSSTTPTSRRELSIGGGSSTPPINTPPGLVPTVSEVKALRSPAKPVSSSPKEIPLGGPLNLKSEFRHKKSSEHVVRALVHLPPRSANSTPTLSTYRKDGSADSSSSCASSAKSTPTHFLSKCAHHSNNLPLRQLSDLTLGDQRKEAALNSSTASMPPTTTVGGGVGGGRIPIGDDTGLGSSSSGAVSSEESVASSSSGGSHSSGNNNSSSKCSVDNCHRPFVLNSFDIQRTIPVSTKPMVNRFILQQKPQLFTRDRVVVDTRPSEDYDPPWDSVTADCMKKSPRSVLDYSSSSSSNSLTTSSIIMSSNTIASGCNSADSSNNSDASSLTPPLLRTSICDSDEQHRIIENNEANQPPSLERPKRPTLQLSFNKESSSRPSLRSNLSLDLNLNSQSPKLKRKDLILNFGCPMMCTMPEPVDASIPLERQGWYHGAISRTEAENLLRILQEGSYLVRNSESSKNDYSLSLKSARGFMHMKIVSSDGKYILGQFSKPFNSIPEMIHHYSICKLPIKGAEHMSLLHPVIDQLL